LVGIKIARAHDASGIGNISVYIGQTIPEAGTVKGLILEFWVATATAIKRSQYSQISQAPQLLG